MENNELYKVLIELKEKFENEVIDHQELCDELLELYEYKDLLDNQGKLSYETKRLYNSLEFVCKNPPGFEGIDDMMFPNGNDEFD